MQTGDGMTGTDGDGMTGADGGWDDRSRWEVGGDRRQVMNGRI